MGRQPRSHNATGCRSGPRGPEARRPLHSFSQKPLVCCARPGAPAGTEKGPWLKVYSWAGFASMRRRAAACTRVVRCSGLPSGRKRFAVVASANFDFKPHVLEPHPLAPAPPPPPSSAARPRPPPRRGTQWGRAGAPGGCCWIRDLVFLTANLVSYGCAHHTHVCFGVALCALRRGVGDIAFGARPPSPRDNNARAACAAACASGAAGCGPLRRRPVRCARNAWQPARLPGTGPVSSHTALRPGRQYIHM